MTFPSYILVASEDLENRRAFKTIIEREGLDPICTSTVSESRRIIATENVRLVFCDRNLPDGNFKELLAAAKSLSPAVRLVVMSREFEWDEYLEAMRLGAFDVIASPCIATDIECMILRARRDEQKRERHVYSLQAENIELPESFAREATT